MSPRHLQAWWHAARVTVVGIGLMAGGASVQAQSTNASPGAEARAVDFTIYAAGSLRTALTQIAQDFAAQDPPAAKLVFGASGLLRDRLASGERADLFASANMEHPQALERSGHAVAVRPFARNELCALATPAFAADARGLVAKLLDTRWRVGTSTPKADPSGDYAFEMFMRIEKTGAGPAGSGAALQQRALQLTGGPNSPTPPTGRSVYGVLVAQGQADVFITYCTNAAQAMKEEPQLKSLPIDSAINVSATYGVATLKGAGLAADRFMAHLLGLQGQQRLREMGFSAP